MSESWREIGDGVHVRRHRHLDLNVGLVVGSERCLVVDTGVSHRQGRALLGEVRRITRLPHVVVNTHAHFDHFFGNSVFRPGEVWGHLRCAEMARTYGEVQRALTLAHVAGSGRPDADAQAADLREVLVDPPDRTFEHSAVLDLGGRTVELRYLGRGHTDNDVVVIVPGAGVVLAGDLVEEGNPPAFEDAFPLDWPGTLGALLPLVTGPVVPGHGDVVDREYVRRQAEDLGRVAEVARAVHAGGGDVEAAWPDTPFPEEYARTALRRALRQLRGEPAYDSPEEILAAAGLS
jgi:glyoxylase-like metal-dependent hydrolase (beta-lactamase superfamily II)